MKQIDVDVLVEWVENWFTKNRLLHPYAKNNNIPIPELYDILEQIPAIDPEPKWIPVSESLPESRVYVLVTYEYQYGLIDHGISWYEDKRKEWMSAREVTAWVPLPEPYREEGV